MKHHSRRTLLIIVFFTVLVLLSIFPLWLPDWVRQYLGMLN